MSRFNHNMSALSWAPCSISAPLPRSSPAIRSGMDYSILRLLDIHLLTSALWEAGTGCHWLSLQCDNAGIMVFGCCGHFNGVTPRHIQTNVTCNVRVMPLARPWAQYHPHQFQWRSLRLHIALIAIGFKMRSITDFDNSSTMIEEKQRLNPISKANASLFFVNQLRQNTKCLQKYLIATHGEND